MDQLSQKQCCIRNEEDFERFSQLIDEEDDSLFQYEELYWNVDDYYSGAEIISAVWELLKHPKSNVRLLDITEGEVDALAYSGTMACIKEWCMTVPAKAPRILQVRLHINSTELSEDVLDDLRDALTYPGNGVQELVFDCRQEFLIGMWLLYPVLKSRNNELRMLHLSGELLGLDDEEVYVLSLAFKSPNCKLTSLAFDGPRLDSDEACSLLNGLQALHSLEQLVLGKDTFWLNENATTEQRPRVFFKLGELLMRPGNRLHHLTWNIDDVTQKEAAILAETLTSEHCRLEELDCRFSLSEREVALPLFNALRHSNTRLKTLTGKFSGGSAFAILGQSLKGPNCRLECLHIVGFDATSWDAASEGKAVADALAVSKTTRLKELYLVHNSRRCFLPWLGRCGLLPIKSGHYMYNIMAIPQ